MLEALIALEDPEFIAATPHSAPPNSIGALYEPVAIREKQINAVRRQTKRAGITPSSAPEVLVDVHNANQGQAYSEGYVASYSLPFQQDDYQRIIRNQLIRTACNPAARPAEQLKALELLGKTTPVQAFADEKTVNVNITNKTVEEIKNDLRSKLGRLIEAVAQE